MSTSASRALLLVVVTAAVACSDRATSPSGPVDPVGAYALLSFNGAQVPACDSPRCIRGGSLLIESARLGQRYVLADTEQSGYVYADTGTWDFFRGDTIVLTPTPLGGGNPPANGGVLVGNTLTLQYTDVVGYAGDLRVYRR